MIEKYYIFMIFNGTLVVPNWTIVPGLLIDVFCMLTLGTLMGMMASRFRDLRFLLPNISNLFFFLTPIYWEVNMLGPKEWIAEINPLYNMVSIIRQPLLGQHATTGNWLYSIGMCVTGFIAWAIFFVMFRRRIPFWV